MRAVKWMIGTLFSFSLMAICARELSGNISIYQTLFFRSLVGLTFIHLIILISKRKIKYSTNNISLHMLRNSFHFLGQYGWFLGIGLLPLSEVFALEFTVPIWTLIIAAIFLGEKITPHKVIAVLLGSLGIIVILQPGITIINSASLLVLGSAVFYAISHTATKSLSSSESIFTILFYMCLIQLPIGLLLSINNWVWPSSLQWIWLLIIGVTALSAHYCMTNAMRYATASTVVTLDFFRLPLIALVGAILYSEPFEFTLIIGGLLILTGNIVNLKKSN